MDEYTCVKRALEIVSLTDGITEVDDEYLETWLMLGPPDGATFEEIMEEVSDDNTYTEWYNLGKKILKIRSTLY